MDNTNLFFLIQLGYKLSHTYTYEHEVKMSVNVNVNVGPMRCNICMSIFFKY